MTDSTAGDIRWPKKSYELFSEWHLVEQSRQWWWNEDKNNQLILVTENLLAVWKFRVSKWETNARGLVLKILKAYQIL